MDDNNQGLNSYKNPRIGVQNCCRITSNVLHKYREMDASKSSVNVIRDSKKFACTYDTLSTLNLSFMTDGLQELQ